MNHSAGEIEYPAEKNGQYESHVASSFFLILGEYPWKLYAPAAFKSRKSAVFFRGKHAFLKNFALFERTGRFTFLKNSARA
jgi:hypothetical protein